MAMNQTRLSRAPTGDCLTNATVECKHSEIEDLPQDWMVTIISTVADVRTGPFGSLLHERDYVDDGTPIVTVEHLGEYGISHDDLPMVSAKDRDRLASYKLRTGDIVFSRVGSVDRNSLVGEKEDGWLFSGRTLRVRITDKTIYPPYLNYYFHSESFKRKIYSVAVGQTMASLNTEILNSLYIIFPPISEQHIIAEALSEVDGLLGALEALIAKKQIIKQATMQQLLTGKTRLPGFSGKWKSTTLGTLAEIYQPVTISTSLMKDHGFPVYGANGVIGFYDKYNHNTWQVVVTCRGSTCGTVKRTVDRSWITGNTMVLNCDANDSLDKIFFYYMIYHQDFSGCITGTGQPQIVRMPLFKFSVYIPININEQRAIAEILSDIDTEIATLERRRNKTRAIKQGMMQQLLTGRIRLVKTGAES